MGIVLDKSFLQGVSRDEIIELSKNNRLLVSDALFFEMLTTSIKNRAKCFSKFPTYENPVDLINHIGFLLRYEIDNHKKSNSPSSNKENSNYRFIFNEALKDPNYVLPDYAQETISQYNDELKNDVYIFLKKANTITDLFPELLNANKQAARTVAENCIAKPGSLIQLISSFNAPPEENELPAASVINEHWAIYRYLQVQLLFAIDLYVRFNGSIPESLTEKQYIEIEHDVLDAQLLALGLMEGAFATREKKLQRWWKLLMPNGMLLL